jgi:hypothetical protein
MDLWGNYVRFIIGGTQALKMTFESSLFAGFRFIDI